VEERRFGGRAFSSSRGKGLAVGTEERTPSLFLCAQGDSCRETIRKEKVHVQGKTDRDDGRAGGGLSPLLYKRGEKKRLYSNIGKGGPTYIKPKKKGFIPLSSSLYGTMDQTAPISERQFPSYLGAISSTCT